MCRLVAARKARPEMLHHSHNPHSLIGGTPPDHVDSALLETAAPAVVVPAFQSIWRSSADPFQVAQGEELTMDRAIEDLQWMES